MSAGVSIKIGANTTAMRSAFAELRKGFSGLSGAIRSFSVASISATAKVATSIAKGIGGAISKVSSMFSNMLTGGGGLGSVLRLAGIAGLGALITDQARGAFEAATGYEDMRVRIEQFTGSAEAAKAVLSDISQFSLTTPFEMTDLNQALSTLMGAGVTSGVTDIVKALGGVSKDGQQLTDLADALAKGFAKGKFQTEELNKFLERGINLMPQFTAVTGLAGDELTKAIEKGLKFDDVTESIRRMSAEGGQFFGLLKRQSQTTTGVISNLVDSWNTLRREFAQPILDALKPVLMGATGLITDLIPRARELGQTVSTALLQAFAVIRSGKTLDLLRAGVAVAFQGGLDVLMRGLRAAIAFLFTALPPVLDAAFAKLRDPQFWQGIALLFQGIGEAFSAEIRSALPNSKEWEVEAMRAAARIDQARGGTLIGRSGGVDFSAVLTETLAKGIANASAQLTSSMSPGLRAALESLKTLLHDSAAEAEKLKAMGTVDGPAAGATGAGAPTTAAAVTSAVQQMARSLTIATSTARIGGGGFGVMLGQPLVNEQKKTNGLLQKILDRPNSMTARYA